MMNFQTPFWSGAQGIKDLPAQFEVVILRL